MKADTGVGKTNTTTRPEAVGVYGTTSTTTPGDTSSSSNMPPFLSVNIWKRVS